MEVHVTVTHMSSISCRYLRWEAARGVQRSHQCWTLVDKYQKRRVLGSEYRLPDDVLSIILVMQSIMTSNINGYGLHEYRAVLAWAN